MDNLTQTQPIRRIESFGDARRVILETILDLRSGKISVERSMAIAENLKVLNDSIQTEVNVAKVAIMAKEKGETEPKLKMLQKVLRYYGLSFEQIDNA